MSYQKTEDWTTLPAALLSLAKQHFRVDFADDDTIITKDLQWAIAYCQAFWQLQVFSANVTWLPADAIAASRYQCPVQPVTSFTVMSDAVNVSADYALEAGALTEPVWLVHSDGTPFPADAAVTLVTGYTDPDKVEPHMLAGILRVASTLYEYRESVTAFPLDQMPFWLNDMLGGLWVPRA